jgi:hypothetical protein
VQEHWARVRIIRFQHQPITHHSLHRLLPEILPCRSSRLGECHKSYWDFFTILCKDPERELPIFIQHLITAARLINYVQYSTKDPIHRV